MNEDKELKLLAGFAVPTEDVSIFTEAVQAVGGVVHSSQDMGGGWASVVAIFPVPREELAQEMARQRMAHISESN